MSYCNDYTLPLWSKPTLFLPIVGAIPNCNIFHLLRASRAHRIKINCNPNTGLWLSSKHIGKKHQTSIGGALGGTPCRGCYTKSDHVFSVQALTEDFFISKNVLFQHFFTGECVFFGEKYYKQMFVPHFVPKWELRRFWVTFLIILGQIGKTFYHFVVTYSKMGPSQPLFSLLSFFRWQRILPKTGFERRKRPLCQLSNNHFPSWQFCFLFKNVQSLASFSFLALCARIWMCMISSSCVTRKRTRPQLPFVVLWINSNFPQCMFVKVHCDQMI